MRRCKDDWVNATQILKLCNFPKAKRTKILEKGVQQGKHEKVQGGYGRFQGTWIPLEDARNLANQYNISADMVPVLYVDVNDPAVLIAKKSKTSGSSKEGASMKRRYVRKIKAEATTPKKTRYEDSLPPQAVFTQDYPQGRSSAMPHMGSNIHMPMNTLLQNQQMSALNSAQMLAYNMSPLAASSRRSPQQNQHARSRPGNPQLGMPHQQQYLLQQQESIYSRSSFPSFSIPENGMYQQMPPQMNSGHFKPDYHEEMSHQNAYINKRGALSQSTNDTNWSQEDRTRDSDTSLSSNDHKINNNSMEEDNSYAAQLLRFFSEDNAPIPLFLYNPPPDFNVNEAIDDEGHSSLHWAASMANLNLVHLLLLKGANPLVVSNFGLNPLSKCISFNNCFDVKNFSNILDALEMCLINTDINGRTPLHYLCQISKVPSKLPALSYYINLFLAKLKAMWNKNKNNGVNLLKNVLDHQDVNGDTCLHLAARSGCAYLVKFLISNGARDDLLNLNNESAKAIIIHLDLVVYSYEQPLIASQQQQMQMGQPEALNEQQDLHNSSYKDDLMLMDQHVDHMQNHVPTFSVTEHNQHTSTPVKRGSLSTPIRHMSRANETPDTQRTTIQEEVDEFDDRVSKEHLKSLLEKQAGTVDDNKENIFVDRPSKNHEHASTPQQTTDYKNGALGVILEQAPDTPTLYSTIGEENPKPPRLDNTGHIIENSGSQKQFEVQLPMDDVFAMMKGMIKLLLSSYTQEIDGLNLESRRIKEIMNEKKQLNEACCGRVSVFLKRNGFNEAETLAASSEEVTAEMNGFEEELKHKESQLLCSIEKHQAYELANLVQEQESKIEPVGEDENDPKEKLHLSMELAKLQVKRSELVRQTAISVRDYAINNKMNKYRKLISLSCGLRAEDIDSLIDGIEESLMESAL